MAAQLGWGSFLRVSRNLLVLSAVFSSVLALGAPIASADGSGCSAALSTPVFSAFGDQNLYTPFQGSSFENGAQGWSWGNGANIVSGDDDHLLDATGLHAVQIPSGGTAKSPHLCVDSTMPSMRFFVRRVSGSGSLKVTATMDGAGGFTTTVATIAGTTTWAPTAPIVFPVAMAGSNVQFLFSATPGSTFRIDDVLMDPYRRT